jgi:hypothetical protein
MVPSSGDIGGGMLLDCQAMHRQRPFYEDVPGRDGVVGAKWVKHH